MHRHVLVTSPVLVCVLYCSGVAGVQLCAVVFKSTDVRYQMRSPGHRAGTTLSLLSERAALCCCWEGICKHSEHAQHDAGVRLSEG
jgi:hypothetical protein